MKFLFLPALLLIPFFLNAQSVPQGISYQAVARDAQGDELPNQSIGVEFRLLDGPGGNVLYQERHSALTNDFGLFNLVIGEGTIVSGVFSQVNWSGGNVHLAVSVDATGGTNYTFLGESRFQSVPYALSTPAHVWTSTGNLIHPVTPTDSVGIGTTTPQHPLDVAGDINSASGYRVSGTATSGQYLRGDGTRFVPAVIDSADLPGSVKLWGSNGNWLFPQNINQNVGIGTITPVTPLDVNGLINSSTGYVVGGTSSPAGEYLRSDGTKFIASPILATDLPSSLVPWQKTGNKLYPTVVNDSVGIGTNNPVHQLDVGGRINSSGGYLHNNSATSGTYLRGNGAAYVSSTIQLTDLPAGALTWTRTGNKLFPSTTGDSLGIGTVSPLHPLHVAGRVNSTAGYLHNNTAATGTYLRGNGTAYVSSSIQLTDLPTGVITWTRSGNKLFPSTIGDSVGVGTATPLHPLHVTGRVNSTAGYLHNNAAATGTYLRGNGTAYVSSTIQSADLPSNVFLWNRNGGRLSPSTVTDSLGIGTATPLYQLQVFNNAFASSAVTASLVAGSTGSATLAMGSNTNNLAGGIRYQNSNSSLYLRTAGTDRLVINNSGNVGIQVASPVYALDVGGTVNSGGLLISGTAPSGSFLRGNGTAFIPATLDTSDLPFSTKLWSFTSGNVHLTNPNHRVGIGTSAPLSPLQINHSTSTSGDAMEINFNTSASSGANAGLYSDATGTGGGNTFSGYFRADGASGGGAVGVKTLVVGSGTGVKYGVDATVSATNGNKIGVLSSVSNAGSNTGVYSVVSGGSSNTAYYSDVITSGSSNGMGMLTNISGSGTGSNFGLSTNITATTTGTNIGLNSMVSGSANTNYSIYATATGGTTNYSGFFDDGIFYAKGPVGLGTQSPTHPVEIQNNLSLGSGNGLLHLYGNVGGQSNVIAAFGNSTGAPGASTTYSSAQIAGYDVTPLGFTTDFGGWFNAYFSGSWGLIASNGLTPSTSTNYVALADGTNAIRIVDGTQATNKVLTSDASGNGSWKYAAPPIKSGSGGFLTIANSGGYTYQTSSPILTVTPQQSGVLMLYYTARYNFNISLASQISTGLYINTTGVAPGTGTFFTTSVNAGWATPPTGGGFGDIPITLIHTMAVSAGVTYYIWFGGSDVNYNQSANLGGAQVIATLHSTNGL